MSTEGDADIQDDELSTDTLQLFLLITEFPALAYQLSCLKQIKNIWSHVFNSEADHQLKVSAIENEGFLI